MTEPIGTYSFLPWLRVGLANRLQPATTGTRATVPVALTIEGRPADGPLLQHSVQKNVQLYGPGDIVGIDRRAIVKTEPRNWITNFESNYLPHIEFYDEDFPWRYTPEVPTDHRLRPWIMLVVLKEGEFVEGRRSDQKPLPDYIVVPGAEALFPPIDQLWAWAHVHIDRDLASAEEEIVSADMGAVLPKLTALLQDDPDSGHSRILCPRRLDSSATYDAFLIPVFETGRLAGLGLDPVQAPSPSHGAWEPDPGKEQREHFPYYHRWTFKTGAVGDFEYLVRLLEPRAVDSRVGRRDIDVLEPGANLPGITDADLGGVLRLGGALRVSLSSLTDQERAEHDKYENWDRPGYPHQFQRQLAAFVNLADDYQAQTVEEAHTQTAFDATVPDPDNPGQRITDPDPLITPPLYGRWHSLTSRLLETNEDNWVHQLNLDPRHRTSAGFGTAIVQQNQEAYMNAAWEQIGQVLEANERIRRAQLGKAVGQTWYDRTLRTLQRQEGTTERALLLTAPVNKRVLVGGVTAHHRIDTSRVPVAIASAPARRILRPRGPLIRALPWDTAHPVGGLIKRINAGEVTPAPPKAPLDGAPTLDDVADAVEPAGPPPWLTWLLHRYGHLLRFTPLFLVAVAFLAVVLCVALPPIGVLLAALLVATLIVLPRLRRWARQVAAAESIRETGQRPGTVDSFPRSPDFQVIEPGESFIASVGGTDSPEAVRYKEALREVYAVVAATRELDNPVTRPPLGLPEMIGAVVAGLDPRITIPRHTYDGVTLPQRVRDQLGTDFVEAMVYPEIDTPMYKPLAAKSVDYFLPNIKHIPPNTITLVETNQPFIEAYMVGLNHEFARELLWREYPTDQRGSYFRQFWDVTGYLDAEGLNPPALREKLKDIPPLHRWSPESKLGDHDHREEGGGNEEELVLVIRGELLKKYPTAVIYAHRARWQRNPDGTVNNRVERRLEDPGPDGAPSPPRGIVKTPLFEAKVDPDIYFFGFDLTPQQAMGGTGESEQDDPGWFFVIKERPGEPRFGLDLATADSLHVWNDLGWGNVVPDIEPGDYLQITADTPTITLQPLPGDESEQAEQAADDKFVRWHANTDAAELAYILYQVPVLVAVHAAEMLPRP